jgi:predicted ester cyclase
MSDFQAEKALVQTYFRAMQEAGEAALGDVLAAFTANDYRFYGVHPFNELSSAPSVAEQVWQPIHRALQPIQRRQDVFMAGRSEIDQDVWVMSMGHFMGLFDQPWLGIPPSGKIAMLRYAEFHCVSDGKISRSGFFCDIIDMMRQAGVCPLPLQTGASFTYPGPRTHDGLLTEPQAPAEAEQTLQLLNRMIEDLNELNKSGLDRCPPEVLQRTWHDDMSWYGPAGIGASFGIPAYQQQHQYPFREGLRDKVFNGHICRFAEGNYACFFGWPNLTNTAAGGFLGMPANDTRADMRVVDVYRREGSKLAENWVLIDLPYWLKQQGLDILERNAALQRGRNRS